MLSVCKSLPFVARESFGQLGHSSQLLAIFSTCALKMLESMGSFIENAPTCYRAPKWPDPEFPRKIPKNTPRAEILEPQENTPKIPKKYAFSGYFFGVFFSGIFRGKFWESRISGRAGVFFWYFSWKFRVGQFRGSVAGRGVLKSFSMCALDI